MSQMDELHQWGVIMVQNDKFLSFHFFALYEYIDFSVFVLLKYFNIDYFKFF